MRERPRRGARRTQPCSPPALLVGVGEAREVESLRRLLFARAVGCVKRIQYPLIKRYLHLFCHFDLLMQYHVLCVIERGERPPTGALRRSVRGRDGHLSPPLSPRLRTPRQGSAVPVPNAGQTHRSPADISDAVFPGFSCELRRLRSRFPTRAPTLTRAARFWVAVTNSRGSWAKPDRMQHPNHSVFSGFFLVLILRHNTRE